MNTTNKQFNRDISFLFNYLKLDMRANAQFAFLDEESWRDWLRTSSTFPVEGHCFETWYAKTASCEE